MEEESIIESFMEAIGGTNSTAEFNFSDLNIKMPGMTANLVINGKVSIVVKPLHETTEK
jgi:hypothetical protein